MPSLLHPSWPAVVRPVAFRSIWLPSSYPTAFLPPCLCRSRFLIVIFSCLPPRRPVPRSWSSFFLAHLLVAYVVEPIRVVFIFVHPFPILALVYLLDLYFALFIICLLNWLLSWFVYCFVLLIIFLLNWLLNWFDYDFCMFSSRLPGSLLFSSPPTPSLFFTSN